MTEVDAYYVSHTDATSLSHMRCNTSSSKNVSWMVISNLGTVYSTETSRGGWLWSLTILSAKEPLAPYANACSMPHTQVEWKGSWVPEC